MANRRFTQFYSTLHNKPVQLDCNFIVDADNANGLGIRSLKGPGIQNVFMHTSAPLVGSGNPNPAAGFIMVQLQDNYNRYFSGFSSFASPASGTPIVVTAAGAALVVGGVYIITALGTTTTANWITLGVPIGTVPAVGVSFVAAATGAGVGSGSVQIPKAAGAGIDHIEVVGDPNLMIKSQSATIAGQTNGSYMLFQCMKNTVLTAPAEETLISMAFVFSNSSIMVQGE